MREGSDIPMFSLQYLSTKNQVISESLSWNPVPIKGSLRYKSHPSLTINNPNLCSFAKSVKFVSSEDVSISKNARRRQGEECVKEVRAEEARLWREGVLSVET